MSHLIQTEAIVLRKRALLGQDSIVFVFSKDQGKLSAVAKGIKKFTSRRAAHLQTGNLVSLGLYAKSEYMYIQQSVVISAFSQIKNDSSKIDVLYKYLFILDRILPEREPEPLLYREVVRSLSYLSQIKTVDQSVFTHFMQQILDHLGYQNTESNAGSPIDQIEEIIHEKIPSHVII